MNKNTLPVWFCNMRQLVVCTTVDVNQSRPGRTIPAALTVWKFHLGIPLQKIDNFNQRLYLRLKKICTSKLLNSKNFYIIKYFMAWRKVGNACLPGTSRTLPRAPGSKSGIASTIFIPLWGMVEGTHLVCVLIFCVFKALSSQNHELTVQSIIFVHTLLKQRLLRLLLPNSTLRITWIWNF